MSFDTILTTYVGDWGRGQLVLLLASSSSWTTMSFIVLGMVFVTQQPQWECSNAADTECQAVQQQQEGICQLSPQQYAWVDESRSLVAAFDLVCGNSWKIGLSNAIFFLGYWVGSSLFGWIADACGRKKCLLLSNLTSAVAAVLCSVSPSYWWYVVARTALGFCCSGLPIAAYVLATESVGPSYRGRAGTYSQMVYSFGEGVLLLMAFWLQNWRHLYVAIAGWCVITAAVYMPFPESPRWLLLHGREQEARATLQWLAKLNGRQLHENVVLSAAAAGSAADELEAAHTAGNAAAADANDPDSSLTEAISLKALAAAAPCVDSRPELDEATDCTALLVDKDDCSTGYNIPQASHAPCHYSEGLFSVFRHPLLRRYFLVTLLLCLVMATTFYTANLATDSLTGSIYINFLITSVGELPAGLVAAVAVDRVGRQLTIGSGLWVTGAACCACSLMPPGWWSTALVSLGRATCSGTWTVAYIYAAELFPTSIRSAALAGTNQASRLGGILAPAIIYISQQVHWSALPFALTGAISILTATLLSKLPETNGMGQPETLADLEHMYGQTTARSQENCSPSLGSRWNSFTALLAKAGGARGVDKGDDCARICCGQSVERTCPTNVSRSSISSNSWYIAGQGTDSASSSSSNISAPGQLQLSSSDVGHNERLKAHQAGVAKSRHNQGAPWTVTSHH